MAAGILLLFVALIGSLHAEEETFHFFGHEFDRTPLGDSIDRASMNLLKEAYESAQDKNLITSPLGVFTLLTQYALGAGLGIREEIVKALGAESYEKLSESYNGLGEKFSKMDRNFLTLANKIYLSNQYNLSDSFAASARNGQGSVERVSFQVPQRAIDEINHWAEEETRGHLRAPVPNDAIDSDTVLALFNVIFFQGHWNVPFKAEDTKDEDFHVDGSTTVKKPTMHLLKTLFYHENKDLGAKLIELPYKEERFRMVLVVPDELEGLSSVIEKVSKKGLLADVFKLAPAGFDIDLHLPKFNIESGLDLNVLLPKVGISKIFSEGATDLVKERAVVVSKAFQKAFVKVDEEGATAGAFTGAVAVPMSWPPQPPPTMILRVDHPFLFLILYEDKILFTGTYSH